MTAFNPVLEHPAISTEKKGLKVVVLRAHLLNLIGKIQNAVPSKPSVPILSNLLLEVRNQQIILTATDLVVSIQSLCEAKVFQEGSIALSAKKFFHLIRELTSSHIEIEVSAGHLVQIKSGTSLFKLHGLSAQEYPELTDISQNPFIEVHAPTLRELFTRTAFAVAREDSRQALNGILLQLFSDKFVIIGTDGKKLAKIHGDINEQPLQGQYLLPLKAVEEMIRCLDEDEVVKLYLSKEKVALSTSASLIISNLLSGDYPDVNRVIPKKASITLRLHREELISLLRQISLFISEVHQSVKFTFTPGLLEISATNSEVGEGKVSMPTDHPEAIEKFEIAFNPGFFIDILKHCKDETISFGLTDSFNPGMITDQTTALFIIMPMRLPSY